jgi:hypothetical protein
MSELTEFGCDFSARCGWALRIDAKAWLALSRFNGIAARKIVARCEIGAQSTISKRSKPAW